MKISAATIAFVIGLAIAAPAAEPVAEPVAAAVLESNYNLPSTLWYLYFWLI